MSELEDEQVEQEFNATDDEQAEEEEQSEEPQAGATPEPEPEPEGRVEDVQMEERAKKIGRSFGTYSRKVQEVMEEDALELLPCPLCPEMHPGFVHKADAGRVPEDVKEVVLMYLGFQREQDYEPDPQTQTCRTCKGKGKTATGSSVPGRETRACPTCNGSGAEGLDVALIPTGANGHTDEAFTLAGPNEAGVVEADNWGEPRILPDGRENPNFGRQPQFKVLVEPYGVTANLTAMSEGV